MGRHLRSYFGCVFQRDERRGFYLSFTWGGRRYYRNAGPIRDVAEQRLAEIHALLKRGIPVEEVMARTFGDPHGSTLRFKDAVPKYIEYAVSRWKASTYTRNLQRLDLLSAAPWAGSFLTAIRPEQITSWVQDRIATDKASGATINRDLSLGSALYRWAIRQGFVEANPFRKVERFSEKGRERETYLTAAESRALLKAASPAFRPLLLTALSTGARRGELLALLWKDVDFARKEIVIRPESEKAGRGRVVPMTEALRAELTAMDDARKVKHLTGEDPVFADANGVAFSIELVRRLFDSTVTGCDGIPAEKKDGVSFHCLRHTAASLMVQAGVPVFDVSKVLGHSVLATTMRYSHFAPEAGRSAVERLGAALGVVAEAKDGKKAEAVAGA